MFTVHPPTFSFTIIPFPIQSTGALITSGGGFSSQTSTPAYQASALAAYFNISGTHPVNKRGCVAVWRSDCPFFDVRFVQRVVGLWRGGQEVGPTPWLLVHHPISLPLPPPSSPPPHHLVVCSQLFHFACGPRFPDVSALGHSFGIVMNGGLGVEDGTSASSPSFAGMVCACPVFRWCNAPLSCVMPSTIQV